MQGSWMWGTDAPWGKGSVSRSQTGPFDGRLRIWGGLEPTWQLCFCLGLEAHSPGAAYTCPLTWNKPEREDIVMLPHVFHS